MADDSNKIKEQFEFHPCDSPRGMLYYKLDELTEHQQRMLNEQKLHIMRGNQKYLNGHPEVRAVVSIIMRAVLKARPKIKIQYFLAKYFTENWAIIKDEIDRYVAERQVSRQQDTELEPDAESEERQDDTPSPLSSLLDVIQEDGSNSYPDLDIEVEPEDDGIDLAVKEILEELIHTTADAAEHELVQQYENDQKQQYDSDPMLLFPYEDCYLKSRSSEDMSEGMSEEGEEWME